jgi:uncharacterized protein
MPHSAAINTTRGLGEDHVRTSIQSLWVVGPIAGIVFGALAFLPSASTAQIGHRGPSFSCIQASEGGVEELICRDENLSIQDRRMATAYANARAAVRGSEGLGALIDNQRAWLRERAACVDLRTQKGLCVSDLMDKRIKTLNQWTRLRMDPQQVSNRPAKTGTTQSSRPPRGPSFDCTKSTTVVERAICNDRELSLLDRQMVDALRQANAATGRSDLPVIATEQRAFLANRNRCAARTTDRRMCIQVAYEMRIQRLSEFTDWARHEVN